MASNAPFRTRRNSRRLGSVADGVWGFQGLLGWANPVGIGGCDVGG
jgi:hypothetical protein